MTATTNQEFATIRKMRNAARVDLGDGQYRELVTGVWSDALAELAFAMLRTRERVQTLFPRTYNSHIESWQLVITARMDDDPPLALKDEVTHSRWEQWRADMTTTQQDAEGLVVQLKQIKRQATGTMKQPLNEVLDVAKRINRGLRNDTSPESRVVSRTTGKPIRPLGGE